MTPEEIGEYLIHIIVIETLLIAVFLVGFLTWRVEMALHPSPAVIHYIQNCSNLTLYPQGCQVLS